MAEAPKANAVTLVLKFRVRALKAASSKELKLPDIELKTLVSVEPREFGASAALWGQAKGVIGANRVAKSIRIEVRSSKFL